jgi:hypothetical protein
MTLTKHRHSTALFAAVASALVIGVLVAPAAHAADPVYDETTDNSAYAYHLNPANQIDGGAYTVTWNPTQRTDDGVTSGSGSAAEVFGPQGITTSTGCPVGFRASSRSFVVTPAGIETAGALSRTQTSSANYGLGGAAMTLTGTRASSWVSLTETTNPNGVNAFVITCDAPANGGAVGNTKPIANSKYFVTFFALDRAAHHWEVTTDPRVSTKTPTTTALAVSNKTQTSLTLTATVSPTVAAGNVQFKKDGVAVGSPVAVAAGVASLPVTGLTAGTAYAFAAEFTATDAATYENSSGTANATTDAAPVLDTETPSVSVTVPTAQNPTPTGLTISLSPSSLSLSGSSPRLVGQVWEATGTLGNVTVNDDRQNASAGGWTLNGKMSTLTGADTIAATNVGWTPSVSSGPGVAGAAVTAGTGTGLSADKPLATGTASATPNVATTVGAAVTLKVPTTAVGGSTPYTGTLTLTLI